MITKLPHDSRIVACVQSRLKPRDWQIGDVLNSCLASGTQRRVGGILDFAE